VALATLGRNTAFALVAVFTWIIAVEGMIRGLKPAFARFLWGENLGTILPWAQIGGDSGFRRSPALALMSVLAYTAVFVVAATLVFRRRDVASTS
jgi:ABC-type transport system involved in multi-copper enzyme maturation permease subunit